VVKGIDTADIALHQDLQIDVAIEVRDQRRGCKAGTDADWESGQVVAALVHGIKLAVQSGENQLGTAVSGQIGRHGPIWNAGRERFAEHLASVGVYKHQIGSRANSDAVVFQHQRRTGDRASHIDGEASLGQAVASDHVQLAVLGAQDDLTGPVIIQIGGSQFTGEGGCERDRKSRHLSTVCPEGKEPFIQRVDQHFVGPVAIDIGNHGSEKKAGAAVVVEDRCPAQSGGIDGPGAAAEHEIGIAVVVDVSHGGAAHHVLLTWSVEAAKLLSVRPDQISLSKDVQIHDVQVVVVIEIIHDGSAVGAVFAIPGKAVVDQSDGK